MIYRHAQQLSNSDATLSEKSSPHSLPEANSLLQNPIGVFPNFSDCTCPFLSCIRFMPVPALMRSHSDSLYVQFTSVSPSWASNKIPCHSRHWINVSHQEKWTSGKRALRRKLCKGDLGLGSPVHSMSSHHHAVASRDLNLQGSAYLVGPARFFLPMAQPQRTSAFQRGWVEAMMYLWKACNP